NGSAFGSIGSSVTSLKVTSSCFSRDSSAPSCLRRSIIAASLRLDLRKPIEPILNVLPSAVLTFRLRNASTFQRSLDGAAAAGAALERTKAMEISRDEGMERRSAPFHGR